MKFANPAGAVSRRLVETIHRRYIDELHETMGWDKESIVEMLLVCDGDVERLRASHKEWIAALNVPPSDVGRGHDALRSFLSALHAERDRELARAKEVRRRMIRSNYADFIAARVEKYWPENEIVTCLELCGSPEEFQIEFAKWVDPKRKQHGPVADFITHLRRRPLPKL